MSGSGILRWLRSDYDESQECLGELRERIAAIPRGDRREWLRELRERFGEFAGRVRQRMARMEEGGYLQPVLEARPRLKEQVELLHHEHDELKRLMDSIQAAVEQLSPTDHFLLRDCCKRIESLLSWVERHEEHENHIVLYVFADREDPKS